MSREQSLRRGAALMVIGALIFFAYAVVFLFRAFGSGGFELGVETLNGVTTQQLNTISNHGLYHSPPCGHGGLHCSHCGRRGGPGLVRSSRRIIMGMDNGRDLAG